MHPASVLLPQSGGCGRLAKTLPEASANARVRQRKENGGVSGRDPEFRWRQGQTQKAQPANHSQTKTPVTGAASVPDEVRNAAAQPFSLTPSKGAFSFSTEKENGGFEAAGLPRHPRSNGKKVFPRGGAAKPAAFAAPSRARDGRTSSSPQGESPLSPAGGTLPIYSALSASTGWSRDALAAG